MLFMDVPLFDGRFLLFPFFYHNFSTCTFEIVLLSDFLQTNFEANNDD